MIPSPRHGLPDPDPPGWLLFAIGVCSSSPSPGTQTHQPKRLSGQVEVWCLCGQSVIDLGIRPSCEGTQMDAVQARLESLRWVYSEGDTAALEAVASRIAVVGGRRDLISYTALVQGITFRLPNVDGGVPFELGIPEWRDVDRAVLGDFLGRICVDSYRRGGFLASSLVTSRGTSEPSEGYWALLASVGAFDSTNQNRRLMFWAKEVAKAHDWYAVNEW